MISPLIELITLMAENMAIPNSAIRVAYVGRATMAQCIDLDA